MDASQILQIVIGVGTGLVGVFVGKGVERAKTKKLDAETESITVSSTEKAINIWENLNQQFQDEVELLRNQVLAIQKEYNEIKKENGKLHQENEKLRVEVGILRNEVKRLTKLAE